jgi:hypothetical protein
VCDETSGFSDQLLVADRIEFEPIEFSTPRVPVTLDAVGRRLSFERPPGFQSLRDLQP